MTRKRTRKDSDEKSKESPRVLFLRERIHAVRQNKKAGFRRKIPPEKSASGERILFHPVDIRSSVHKYIDCGTDFPDHIGVDPAESDFLIIFQMTDVFAPGV